MADDSSKWISRADAKLLFGLTSYEISRAVPKHVEPRDKSRTSDLDILTLVKWLLERRKAEAEGIARAQRRERRAADVEARIRARLAEARQSQAKSNRAR